MIKITASGENKPQHKESHSHALLFENLKVKTQMDVGYGAALRTHRQTVFDVKTAPFVLPERYEEKKSVCHP